MLQNQIGKQFKTQNKTYEPLKITKESYFSKILL